MTITLRDCLCVGAGGFLGSVSRFLVSAGVQHLAGRSHFPYGTLAVNIAGCFIVGLLNGWSGGFQSFAGPARLLLVVGFLGGFTTFSALGHEAVTMSARGPAAAAIIYMAAHVTAGFATAWAGTWLGRHL